VLEIVMLNRQSGQAFSRMVERYICSRIIRFPSSGDFLSKLGEYLAALLSLQSMAILGIADDIFDIRWRHKVLLPAIASIPLLMLYYVDFNVTVIVTPKPFLPYLPPLFDLGTVFSLNS
jgi:UDP-N-acetylmuramyl pentapeptide phosphotransferase/UDP-N-acetylglucosamine-1-phosphate transferase